MTRRKKVEAPEPVDYIAQLDVRLLVLGSTLALISHAPTMLVPESIEQAKIFVAQCRDLLVKLKEQVHVHE